MDRSNMLCVERWPLPTTVKELRGFLGLSRYYRRFIRNYGLMARPLTSLLKKEGWKWDNQATQAFQQLKTTLCTALVLVLPNFHVKFCIDSNALNFGLGAVLQLLG